MDLEAEFHQTMLRVYDNAAAFNFYPTGFKKKVEKLGGLGAAKYFLATRGAQKGLVILRNKGALHISMEVLVLEPRFQPLFTQEELAEASQRLDELGYHLKQAGPQSAPGQRRSRIDQALIHQIGEELTNCRYACNGIAKDWAKGIWPRCLYYERRSEQKGGVVIVGLNPGRADDDERDFLRSSLPPTYDHAVKYWKDKRLEDNKYYKAMREFVDQLELTGPILWTELVKCEDNAAVKRLPPETLRFCVRTYLRRELHAVPQTWPLIAVGRDAYDALAYMFLDRPVVGVPHPTGSFGDFVRVHGANGHLSAKFKQRARNCWEDGKAEAIWLRAD